MEFVNYVLVLVASFIGLFVGLTLAFVAKEELAGGRKYFVLLTRIIFSLMLVFLLSSYRIYWWIIALLVVAYLIIDYNFRIDERYIYTLMAVIIFLSFRNMNLFIMESILIFLYGFPAGSLFTEKLVKKNKLFVIGKLFLNYIHYVVIALLPFLIVNF